MNPLKDFLLFLSKRKFLQKVVTGQTWLPSGRFVSKRFVAGESLDAGISTAQEMNRGGFLITLDHLGESVNNEKSALEAAHEYLIIPERIDKEDNFKLTCSLKLSQMGLDINYDFCLNNIRNIVKEAAKRGKMVTIDMEDSPYTDRTINIYKTMLKEGYKKTGIVIQAYLRRSEKDIRDMLPLGPRIRLCKGTYKEPPDIAFQKKKETDANYIKLLAIMLSKEALAGGAYPEIATHDEKIVNWAIDYIKQNNIPADKFEFQMLYGIRRELQDKIIKQGYRMRVYLPYGTHWYPYFMRRLAERPANLWFLMKNFFKR
jgi:proline dehydrogenase